MFFAATCKKAVSCVKERGGWLIYVAMAEQKIYLHKCAVNDRSSYLEDFNGKAIIFQAIASVSPTILKGSFSVSLSSG